jgi:hypothetical protein
MAKKRKAAGKNKKPRPRARSSRRRAQPYVSEIPLQRGLREFAIEGAHSMMWVTLAFAAVAVAAGFAFAAWSLRPVPEYTSEAVESGSPFDAVFRVKNASEWLPLSHPNVSCMLMHAGAPNLPMVPANDLQLPSEPYSQLGPGASATFRCPLRAAFRGVLADNLGTALGAELFFRISYDMPFGSSWRLTADRGPFVLNTKLLPPRWVAK